MSFREDVTQTVGLNEACQPGLQALRAVDCRRMTASPPRNLVGSVDLDSALRNRFPQEPRWDYGVAWKAQDKTELLHWIEVHPASGTATIGEVSAKLTWLRGWLRSEGARLGDYPRKFVWIASGKSAFQQNSPQMKKLVMAGVFFAGGHYTIAG